MVAGRGSQGSGKKKNVFFVLRAEKTGNEMLFILRTVNLEDGGLLTLRTRKIEEPLHLRITPPIFEEVPIPPSLPSDL